MATMSYNIHPTKGVASGDVHVSKHSTFYTVNIGVTDANGTTSTAVFCDTTGEVDAIMRAMSAAVREWFGESEPEPDYDTIAAEMV